MELENNMAKKNYKFAEMTITIKIYGVGKTQQDAENDALEQAKDMVINRQNFLDFADIKYNKVKQEQTSIDDSYIDFTFGKDENKENE
jgi:hypothetical protein